MSAEAQHEHDAETASVVVHVSGLRPVQSRGSIRYEADVELDIGGVVIQLRSLTIRAEPHGRLGAYLPQSRGSDGVWLPVIRLPPSIERAVATTALEQVGGLIVTSPIKGRDDGA